MLWFLSGQNNQNNHSPFWISVLCRLQAWSGRYKSWIQIIYFSYIAQKPLNALGVNCVA